MKRYEKEFERSSVTFVVSVLECRSGMALCDIEAMELSLNATPVTSHRVWLFEGDWEMGLSGAHKFRELTQVEIPSIGGFSQAELGEMVDELCPGISRVS